MTVIALSLGLLAANIVEPGSGFSGEVTEAAKAEAKETIGEAGESTGFVAFLTEDVVPTSFVEPFVENEILRVLVLALLTAAAISGLPKATRESVVEVFEVMSQIVFRVITPDHVGGAARRVRRHGLHGRQVRLDLACRALRR